MSVKLKVRGSFHRMENFLKRLAANEQYRAIDSVARDAVDALAAATPKDTGNTAASWTYKIDMKRGNVNVSFINFNKTYNGIPIIILLEYGHVVWNQNHYTDSRLRVVTSGLATRGYVKGRRFIKPVINPYLDKIRDTVWEEIQNL